MIRFAIAVAVFGLLFIAVELISRKTKLLTPDDSRKTVHIVSGLLIACLPMFLSFHSISALGIFFVGFMVVSRWLHLFPSIHGVQRVTFGELYYPLSIAVLAWFFPVPAVFVYAVLVLAIADGFASVVGVRHGKHSYTLFGAHKSLEGSATFWVIAFALTIATLSAAGATAPITIFGSLGAATLLTLAEACLKNGLDNLVVPLLSSLVVTMLVK